MPNISNINAKQFRPCFNFLIITDHTLLYFEHILVQVYINTILTSLGVHTVFNLIIVFMLLCLLRINLAVVRVVYREPP